MLLEISSFLFFFELPDNVSSISLSSSASSLLRLGRYLILPKTVSIIVNKVFKKGLTCFSWVHIRKLPLRKAALYCFWNPLFMMNKNVMQHNYIWLINSIVIKEVLVEFDLKSALLMKFSNYLQKFKIAFYRNVNFWTLSSIQV